MGRVLYPRVAIVPSYDPNLRNTAFFSVYPLCYYVCVGSTSILLCMLYRIAFSIAGLLPLVLFSIPSSEAVHNHERSLRLCLVLVRTARQLRKIDGGMSGTAVSLVVYNDTVDESRLWHPSLLWQVLLSFRNG
jgi:hypothetical protein